VVEPQDPFVGVVTAAHVYGAVVEVGKQVVQVDHKVDLVDGKVGTVDGKVDGISTTVADLQNRVRDLEANRWPKSLPTLISALAFLVAVFGLIKGWS
jgi:prophage DNA circulation protein